VVIFEHPQISQLSVYFMAAVFCEFNVTSAGRDWRYRNDRARKIGVGLASHWPCATDFVVF